MICPNCKEDKTYVIHSDQRKTTHRRRRGCKACGYRFNTTEYYVPDEWEIGRRAKPKGGGVIMQETINTLAALVTRYRENDKWNEERESPKHVTILSLDEIEAIERAISLIMGE